MKWASPVAAGLVVLVTTWVGLGQSGLKREIAALRDAQAGVVKDLDEIKTLVRNRPGAPAAPAANPVIEIASAAVKGKPDAPLVLVEFSDYQ